MFKILEHLPYNLGVKNEFTYMGEVQKFHEYWLIVASICHLSQDVTSGSDMSFFKINKPLVIDIFSDVY